jgi:hypothetical protein
MPIHLNGRSGAEADARKKPVAKGVPSNDTRFGGRNPYTPGRLLAMRGRLGVFIGFGAGYVLGAKAGHGRYEQLQRLYENLLNSRAFQQASGKAKGAAAVGFEQAKDKAAEGASKVTEVVKEKKRAGGDSHGSLTVAPPPQG